MKKISNVWNVVKVWDEFWFSPRPLSDINSIRITIAAIAAVYALTWLTSLSSWIAEDGLLSRSQAEFLIGRGVEGTGSEGRISLLFSYIPSSMAWSYALLTSLACATVAVGFGGRIVVAVTWALLLGLVHRVPMIQGPGDFLITGVFGYLLICPGVRLKKLRSEPSSPDETNSWLCNLAIRLFQCHVFLWFAASLVSHSAEPIWWNGTAPWWLSFSGDQSLISMRFWLDHPYVMNLVCYIILGLQAWVLVSFLVPTWQKSGIVALTAFAFFNLVIANDWVYSLAIVTCIPALLVSRELKTNET
ncbi:MAG: hypothetical protein NTW52_18535 [Planctomycetota bacterium]|nr:hypothetical protein [Planctomycetota bacterium]